MKNPVSDLFGRSPIKPLQEHMSVVVKCTAELGPFLEATYTGDWQEAESAYNRIRTLEQQGDDLKKEFRLNMPNSLFMPVPRTDLLDLITLQDKVANTVRDIAGVMLGRKMLVPELIREDFTAFATSAVRVAEQAQVAIDELDELLESGFKGREIDIVKKIIEQLNSREVTADDNEREIRHKLLTIENDMPPVSAMFLYNIIDKIGELANRAQRVGSRLQLLLAR
jgi:uncharacterized protein